MRPRLPSRLDRRLLSVGLALVVLGPASGFALAEAGQTYGLAAPPAAPFVTAGSPGQSLECGLAYNHCNLGNFSTEITGGGWVAVAAPLGQLFVVLQNQQQYSSTTYGQLVTLASGTFQPIAAVPLPCVPIGAYYPGTGSLGYTECLRGANNSVLVFNISSAKAAATIPVPPSYSGFRAMALDAVRSTLFCVDVNANLTEVNLRNDSFVRTDHTTLRVGEGSESLWGSRVWLDPSRGLLFLASANSSALIEVDTATGAVVRSVGMPGSVTAVVGDPSANLLLVSFANQSRRNVSGTEVLNLSSLTEIQNLSLFSDYPIVIDTAFDQAYLTSGAGLSALDLRSLQVVPSPSPLQVAPTAFDPDHEEVLGIETGGFADLVVYDVHHSFTAVTPYVGVPVLGTSVPLVVGATGLVLGATLLGVVRLRSARRAWLTPDQL